MVTLPPEYTATKFPGYFWNTKTLELYSLKVGGELRKLPLKEPNYWNNWRGPGYRVSHKGRPRVMFLDYLEKLERADSVITVRDNGR